MFLLFRDFQLHTETTAAAEVFLLQIIYCHDVFNLKLEFLQTEPLSLNVQVLTIVCVILFHTLVI